MTDKGKMARKAASLLTWLFSIYATSVPVSMLVFWVTNPHLTQMQVTIRFFWWLVSAAVLLSVALALARYIDKGIER